MTAILEVLRDGAGRDPNAIALRAERVRLSRRRLVQCVDAFAAELAKRDARVIGLFADNGIDWIVADLAGMLLGATLVPLPHFFTGSQLAHVADASGMDTLLVDVPDRLPPELASRFDACGSLGGLTILQSQRRPLRGAGGRPPAKITFTSGSTGAPKGVCLSADCIDEVTGRLCEAFGDLDSQRHLCVLPLATLLENIAGTYVPLALGTAVELLPLAMLGLYGSSRMNGAVLRDVLEQRRISSLILQPQMLRELTAAAARRPLFDSELLYVAVGGARVAEADLSAARAVGIPAYQGYGLSECASVVALNLPAAVRPGSVGRILPGLDVAIADDGEILVRGQSMSGYLDSPPCAAGPVATGDLGYLDDDGFLYVTGRKKDIFITAYGRNVSPEWPESELVHEAAIGQACVFGEGQSSITAVIVPAAHGTSRAEIAAAILRANSRLPDYAAVGECILSPEPFSPANGLLTSTGKPKRHAIHAKFVAPAGQHALPGTGSGGNASLVATPQGTRI